MLSSISRLLAGVALLLSTSLAACAPGGARIHVASATASELQAAQDSNTVWYEFREGDEVPFQFFVFGDAMSQGKPTKLFARKNFWLILSKKSPMRISYNGRTASPDEMEFMLSIVPGKDGKAQVLWLNHMGKGDPKKALAEIIGPAK